MSFPRYPAYKPSGVEWLGEVPEHWEVKPAKRLMGSIEQGWSPQCENYSVDGSEGWGVLKVGCVNGGVFRPTENKWLPVELDPRPELAVLKGDLLVSRANTRELVGSAAVAIQDYPNLLLCDKLYRMKVDNKEARPQFLSYFLGSREARGKIELEASGASDSMLNISQSVILELPCPAPPAYEQASIATFLDHETGKIDALIAEQQRLIELLQEKRQAVISHAVTKGLNPHALMKDSGVEWLGEVPEHWHSTNIKRIAKLFGRIGFRGYTVDDLVGEDEGAIALAPGNLKDRGFSLEKKTYISWAKYEESPEIKIAQNDVLLVKTGSTFGKCCFVDGLHEAATLNPQMIVFKESSVENEFLFYLIMSSYVQATIKNLNKGSALPTVTQESLGSIGIFIPPRDEQISIVDQIRHDESRIFSLVDQASNATKLLNERRSALISAAVTGQVDVRGLVPEAVAA